MKRLLMSLVVVTIVFCVFCATSGAAAFEPLFRVTKLSGDVQVRKADGGDFGAAEDGKAYPYGSTVKTGPDSGCSIKFSENNECTVGADAFLTVNADGQTKTVDLANGKIDVNLETDYNKLNGDTLNIAAANITVGAVGCRFSVELRTQPELKIIMVMCQDGTIKVWNPYFLIAEMQSGDYLSISVSRDMTFTRLRNEGGTYSVSFTDQTGQPKIIETKVGNVIKIWQTRSVAQGVVVVVIKVLSPEGDAIDTISYRMTDQGVIGAKEGDVVQEEGEIIETEEEQWSELIIPDPEGGSVFDRTTTTTVPSMTPVGRR